MAAASLHMFALLYCTSYSLYYGILFNYKYQNLKISIDIFVTVHPPPNPPPKKELIFYFFPTCRCRGHLLHHRMPDPGGDRHQRGMRRLLLRGGVRPGSVLRTHGRVRLLPLLVVSRHNRREKRRDEENKVIDFLMCALNYE